MDSDLKDKTITLSSSFLKLIGVGIQLEFSPAEGVPETLSIVNTLLYLQCKWISRTCYAVMSIYQCISVCSFR